MISESELQPFAAFLAPNPHRREGVACDHALFFRQRARMLADWARVIGQGDDPHTLPRRAYHETVLRMTLAIEKRDYLSGAHSLRTGKAAALLARSLGCGADYCERIELAAPTHDIGKIAVPESILLKPGRLTDSERRVVETHCGMGALLLSSAGSPELRLAFEIALTHHERWDGKGYPQGLAGDAIPLSGQLVSIASVFDSLNTDRPYRVRMPLQVVLDYLECERGHAFSPTIVDAFLPLVPLIVEEGRKIDSTPRQSM